MDTISSNQVPNRPTVNLVSFRGELLALTAQIHCQEGVVRECDEALTGHEGPPKDTIGLDGEVDQALAAVEEARRVLTQREDIYRVLVKRQMEAHNALDVAKVKLNQLNDKLTEFLASTLR